MKKHPAVVRNLLAASAFALVGLGMTPSRSNAAAVNNKGNVICFDDGECTLCIAEICWAGCCGDCSGVIVICEQ